MFDDRSHAGRVLGDKVSDRVHDSPVVVLALPRGGVPVGVEVARRLGGAVEFDVFLVRKLGVPHREELAFGAIASGGVRVLNRSLIEELGLSSEVIERTAKQERFELERRELAYRQGRPLIPLLNQVVILVDDGLATGASMIAAVRAVRLNHPRKVVVAVPVASEAAAVELRHAADELICPEIQEPFHAVGYWYRDFEQVTDARVCDLLRECYSTFQ